MSYAEVERLTPQSLKSLYQRHGAALAAYACSRGLDFASAEDIVQQLFLKLLRDQTVPMHAAAAYLYRSVRNASLNLRRNRRQEVELAGKELWLTHAMVGREEVLSVQRAVGELPEEQREAVVLKIWGGLTLQEIADATDVSLNTVASRYRYAIEKLRERLLASPAVKD